jgi:hypothetical protein
MTVHGYAGPGPGGADVIGVVVSGHRPSPADEALRRRYLTDPVLYAAVEVYRRTISGRTADASATVVDVAQIEALAAVLDWRASMGTDSMGTQATYTPRSHICTLPPVDTLPHASIGICVCGRRWITDAVHRRWNGLLTGPESCDPATGAPLGSPPRPGVFPLHLRCTHGETLGVHCDIPPSTT